MRSNGEALIPVAYAQLRRGVPCPTSSWGRERCSRGRVRETRQHAMREPHAARYECVSGRDQHELRGLRTRRWGESHSDAAQETATTTSTLHTFRRKP